MYSKFALDIKNSVKQVRTKDKKYYLELAMNVIRMFLKALIKIIQNSAKENNPNY